MSFNPLQSIQNLAGKANVVVSAVKNVANVANSLKEGNFAQAFGFMKNIRGANLPTGGMPQFKSITRAQVRNPREANDWRVKLSVPSMYTSDVMRPLARTGGMVFPFTPTVILQHSANYNSIQPIHNNYPFYAYQNSQVDQITITGDFFVENEEDAEYWVACVHYLKSVTKMFYGADAMGNTGAPPPIVRLNGYGDYVFNEVPVVIQSFMIDLPQDVDYIKANIGLSGGSTYATDFDAQPTTTGGNSTWVPSQCAITVNCLPIYSRAKVEEFSLAKFVNGDYIGSGDGYL